jgi:isoquinoline 1-oxidoreductase beta subunit
MAITRREFVASGAVVGAGLLFGLRFDGEPLLAQVNEKAPPEPNPFDAWIHLKPTGETTVIVAKSEMGQGVKTGLPMIFADEAELDWDKVTVEQAPTLPNIYQHMGTGGSSSTRTKYMPLRQAGATVRELMIAAAAAQWNVPAKECSASKSVVTHKKSSQTATYAQLLPAASKLPLPDPKKVPLKKPSEFTLIGHPVARVDIPPKVNGSAQFGIDVRVPGMLYAVIARCPTFGGKPAKFDAGKAKAMTGVRDVFEIPANKESHTAGGVVVVAESTWAAMKGREALDITWDRGPAASETSEMINEALRQATNKAGERLRNEGDVDEAFASAPKKIEAIYEAPFLAHATMEPMNITMAPGEGSCEVWAPTQAPDWVQRTVAGVMGLPPEKVNVHTTLLGGGFGRRYMPDYPAEVAQIVKVTNKPVQLVWTREDDMTHDFYRPASCHRMRGALNAKGQPIAWSHTLASVGIGSFWHNAKNIYDSEQGGAQEMPYAIPNVRLDFNNVDSAVPRGWWRSVENSFNGFVVECFIDVIAAAAGQDPVQFRKALLHPIPGRKPVSEHVAEHDRLRGVLELAAQKSNWSQPLAKPRGRGIAAWFSFGSYFAEVAEVTIVNGKTIQVDRLVAAVDCGRAINPESVRSQTEGAMIFGLSAALKGEITIHNGAVDQENFHGYEILKLNESPPVEVYSGERREAQRHGRAGTAADRTGGSERDLRGVRAAAAEDAFPAHGVVFEAIHPTIPSAGTTKGKIPYSVSLAE